MSPMPSSSAAAPTTHSWLNKAPVKAIAGEVAGVVAGVGVVTAPGTYVMV
jgi:hypothetical protein